MTLTESQRKILRYLDGSDDEKLDLAVKERIAEIDKLIESGHVKLYKFDDKIRCVVTDIGRDEIDKWPTRH